MSIAPSSSPAGTDPEQDLEAWFAEEINLPCETKVRWGWRRRTIQCGQPAEWAARERARCGCTEHVVICEQCRQHYLVGGIVCTRHPVFTSRLTWIERIRSSR